MAPAIGHADAVSDGIASYNQARWQEAADKLRGAPGPEAQAYLAGALAKLKKYSDAEAPAKAALAANPTHPVAVAALGAALVGQRKFDEGVDRMSAAIKAKGDLAYAFFWRAQAYQGKKQKDRMVEDLESFVRLAPNAPEAASVKQALSGLH